MQKSKAKKLYRLYIDESGDHSYGKKNTFTTKIEMLGETFEIPNDEYVELADDRNRYLSLTGCLIEKMFYEKTFCLEMEQLKKSHFTYDHDDPLIFHREDMVNKRKSFYRLSKQDKEAAFNDDLLRFLKNMEYTIITVVVDKKNHIERYGCAAFHPYHYCLTAMLERYCGLLSYCNAKGDVLAESRGGREDELLKKAYRDLYNDGSKWRPGTHFQNVLTSKEIKLKKKDHNIAGLQLADLLAHPLRLHTLVENGRIAMQKDFGVVITETVMHKFNKHGYSGKIAGYGRVLL